MKTFVVLFLLSISLSWAKTDEEIINGIIKNFERADTIKTKLTLCKYDENRGFDTTIYQVIYSMDAKDSALGGYYNLKQIDIELGNINIYSGKSYLEFYPELYGVKSVKEFTRKKNPLEFQREEINFGDMQGYSPACFESEHFIQTSHFEVYKRLKERIKDIGKEKLRISDTIILSKQAYLIDLKNYKIAFDKNTNELIFCFANNEVQTQTAFFSDYQTDFPNKSKVFSRKFFSQKMKFSDSPKTIESERLPLGQKVPDWTFKDLNGLEANLYSNNGKPSLVIVTEVGCPGCMYALPVLSDIYKEYGDKINFYSIYPNDSEKNVANLSKSRKIEYPMFPKAKSIIKPYRINSYPNFFIIDKNLILKKILIGYSEELGNDFRKEFEKLIKK